MVKKATNPSSKRGVSGGSRSSAPLPRSRFARIVRGLGFLLLLAVAAAAAGSYFMRRAVIERLAARSLTSSSVALSRPFPVEVGTNLAKSKVTARLNRLGYRAVSTIPERPGQYFQGRHSLYVYTRESVISPGRKTSSPAVRSNRRRGPAEKKVAPPPSREANLLPAAHADTAAAAAQAPASGATVQAEMLIRISHDAAKEVTELTDVKYQRELNYFWLEPELLTVLGNDARRAITPISLSEDTDKLVKAVLAIEDERFYMHFGIDPLAMLRAAVVNFQSGRIVQGGSTITQQLVKNLFLESERTIMRKLVEAFSALLVETAFDKEQILELYLNEVFLGQEGNVAIHGFGEAARSFFAKDVSELTWAEAATLAGIIKAPSAYSPRRFPKRALERRQVVLQKMRELESITEEQYRAAAAERLQVQDAVRSRRRAPYFIDYVKREVKQMLSVDEFDSEPLKIYTGLDVEYQRCAEQAVEQGLAELEKTYPRLKKAKSPVQAALVATTPATGQILAWVGGRDFSENQYDRVSLAKRQPGSAFKPFVYLTALDGDLNDYRVAKASSLLADEPIELEVIGTGLWRPQNYDRKFRGDVTVRQALVHSLNVPTVILAMKVGIDKIAQTASIFGFGRDLPAVPSLALGAGEVTPLEMVRAYGAIANGGILMRLRPILAVAANDREEPIYHSELEEFRAAAEPATYVLTDMMRSVIESGTGNVVRRRGYKGPAAGKTGTSNDLRDAWFSGFTPRILAVVWVGFDDNTSLKLTGSQAAAPIWTNFMLCASPMEPDLEFIPPRGVVAREVDLQSGYLDTGHCPPENVVREIYVEGTEPLLPCPIHSPRSHYGDEVEVLPPAAGLPPAAQPDRRGGSTAIGRFFDELFDW